VNRRWTTRILAEYTHELSAAVPDAALCKSAGDVLIDLIGCAAAGYAAPAAQAARESVLKIYAEGPARIWFTSDTRHAEGAAMANSTAASALDLDDGHRRAGGHPGAAIVPAVLSIGPAVGASGRDMIRALAAGYEVGVRVSAARDFSRLDTLSTGRWCAYGVAAAAGLLCRDKADVLAQAFSIAGVLSPGLSAAGYSTRMGNQVKEGIPWALTTGLTALELARQGMTGPLDILDHADYFDAEVLRADLGRDFLLTTAYFKPYACCRWIHAAIDALRAILDDPDGRKRDAAEIRSLDVYTFERALRLNNYPDPETLEAAQYSLPFCLALAAEAGAGALLPMSPEHMHRPEVVSLARRVHLHVAPDLEARFPAEAGARVRVQFADGQTEKTVRHPLGDPVNPMDRQMLTAKFDKLAAGMLSPENLDMLPVLIARLDELEDITPVVECLVRTEGSGQ
jgi:2-methylcitrate dehydratase PrpD